MLCLLQLLLPGKRLNFDAVFFVTSPTVFAQALSPHLGCNLVGIKIGDNFIPHDTSTSISADAHISAFDFNNCVTA